MRSSEPAAHRLLMHMCSHIALVAQGLALCVIPYHPCMRACVLFLEWSLLCFFLQFLFQLYLMSIPAPDEISMEDHLCDSSLGRMVTLDYVTPLTRCKNQRTRKVGFKGTPNLDPYWKSQPVICQGEHGVEIRIESVNRKFPLVGQNFSWPEQIGHRRDRQGV